MKTMVLAGFKVLCYPEGKMLNIEYHYTSCRAKHGVSTPTIQTEKEPMDVKMEQHYVWLCEEKPCITAHKSLPREFFAV